MWLGEPHFIVTVAAAIFDAEGKILLCDHVFRRGASWGMPGGFLLKAEDPEDAIRRELREELGIEPVECTLLLVRTFPDTRQIEIIYRCAINEVPRVESVELRDVGWFPLDDLPSLTGDQRRLIERVGSVDPSDH